ncbi:acyl carrier protein, partial [Streptomyces kanasensis]|uniref:acyl carrier protein n=1 Tax=Streptomyces kanasensis TaxID=936756 RepID=UPI000A68D137
DVRTNGETTVITVATVCSLIEKKLGSKAAGLTLDENTAFDSVGLSSLQIADIVYTIEDDAEIELDPSEAANVKTVGDLVTLVEATKSAGAAA